MKSLGILLITLFVLAADVRSAHSALRVPQVQFQSGILQEYLNAVGESLDVNTAQLDAQHWGAGISNNSTVTIDVEILGNAAGDTFGLYNGDSAAPALYQLFPGAATNGWYAEASFRTSPTRVLISLFDNLGVFEGSTTYLGDNRNDFGFYLKGTTGTFYSQDIRNPDHAPHVLSYAGTGINSGSYWMAFERDPGAPIDHDFADAVMFLQGPGPLSTAPVPVLRSTWSSVKARFR